MFEAIFWGATLRFFQSLLQASPFILTGLFVAGVLQRLCGHENTRRLFGGRGFRALVQSWAIGMLLPVCSLGVIPAVRSMRKAGLPGGTILAFALAAPLFNPLSLLYGLTLSEPFVIGVFALCSLIVITIVGLVWDRQFPSTEQPEPQPAAVPFGLKRLLSIVVVGAREIVGFSGVYMLIGLLGVALLAVLLPSGSMQRWMNGGNPWAPILMSVVAIPAYATPMLAMSQLGTMFQHGNSVGAAFVLLTLGAGMNLGLVAWMVHSYGWKRTGGWLGLLFGVVLILSYGIERPLFPQHGEISDHTHAFDVYCSPFQQDTRVPAKLVFSKLRQDLQIHEIASFALLVLLMGLGLGLKFLDKRWVIETWLERPPADAAPKTRFDIIVPAPVLGGVALVAVVAFSIVGCYAYYPSADEVFEEITLAKTEALTAAMSGQHEQAAHWIAVWDDWTRKLQIGVYLREWKLSEYHCEKARVIREKLELLEHESADHDLDEVRSLVAQLNRASLWMKTAYLEER
jgi:uncharacterized protein